MKLLVISPVPSHPQNAGNRARIYSLLLNLKEMGHNVYFLHIQREPGDEEAMKSCWGSNFYSILYQEPKTAQKKPPKRLGARILRKALSLVTSDPRFTYLIDDWYDDSVNAAILNLSKKISPDVVMVEYVFFSKALELFEQKVLKIIDTHDKFADRYKIYQKQGKAPRWYSTTKREEIKGLNRADVILAIQQKEADWFANILKNKQIFTVGHVTPLHKSEYHKINHKILFVGSSNLINVEGINYFIKDVFPIIKSKFDDVELVLAGDVCDQVEVFDGCLKLGRLDNLQEAYDLVDIVINPVRFGTGLKIKNIETLGYSKALVTTLVGAEGIEEGAGKAFLIANSPEEFFNAIKKIFSDAEFYEELSKNAYSFAKQWNQRSLKILTDILNPVSK
ncbi:glycosyltransferase family 4 protein [Dendronalium sp. ChiSLP03b]|uniref:glycosyltransferase family 4 protein n=1 Tax=Dendronalium sp. ChiSLP03b TaxID=3075381 RepID=UPI002AD3BB1C|nr:glycosyltransferase family 4 protein [Dendronalium sp. ChiSLP03b]